MNKFDDYRFHELIGIDKALIIEEVVQRSLEKGNRLYDVRKAKHGLIRPRVYFIRDSLSKPHKWFRVLDVFNSKQAPLIDIGIVLIRYRIMVICDYSSKYKVLKNMA